MPIFQAVRRYKKWPIRVPLWDARECPDCGALTIGDNGQDEHRAYHEAIVEWQDWAEEVIKQAAAGAGLTPWEPTGDAGEYHALDLNPDELHDAKRRRIPWARLAPSTTGDDDDG